MLNFESTVLLLAYNISSPNTKCQRLNSSERNGLL